MLVDWQNLSFPLDLSGPNLARVESLSLCNAGTYSYPRSPKVTAECRDLLDKIFVVTPKERITLLGIQVGSQCLHLCSMMCARSESNLTTLFEPSLEVLQSPGCNKGKEAVRA